MPRKFLYIGSVVALVLLLCSCANAQTVSATPSATPTPIDHQGVIPMAVPTTMAILPAIVGQVITLNSMTMTEPNASGGVFKLVQGLGADCSIGTTTLVTCGSGSSSFECEVYGLVATVGFALCARNDSATTVHYDAVQH
jgi:hypothetical protein